jgi:hypothetical protein
VVRVPRQAFRRFVDGAVTPASLKIVGKLADALDVEPAELLRLPAGSLRQPGTP